MKFCTSRRKGKAGEPATVCPGKIKCTMKLSILFQNLVSPHRPNHIFQRKF